MLRGFLYNEIIDQLSFTMYRITNYVGIQDAYISFLFIIHLRQRRKNKEKKNVVGDHDDDDLRVYLVHNLLCTK